MILSNLRGLIYELIYEEVSKDCSALSIKRDRSTCKRADTGMIWKTASSCTMHDKCGFGIVVRPVLFASADRAKGDFCNRAWRPVGAGHNSVICAPRACIALAVKRK